jgi:hypothetical protein
MNDQLKTLSLLMFALSIGFTGSIANAQTAPSPAASVLSVQGAPVVGNLQMPLVSPQQAEQFFAGRAVPPSNAPAIAGGASSPPPQPLNVDPILGHELPTDAVSAAGFPRADFAIAKPDDGNKKSAAGGAVAGQRGPSTTAIRQEPPVIGKP